MGKLYLLVLTALVFLNGTHGEENIQEDLAEVIERTIPALSVTERGMGWEWVIRNEECEGENDTEQKRKCVGWVNQEIENLAERMIDVVEEDLAEGIERAIPGLSLTERGKWVIKECEGEKDTEQKRKCVGWINQEIENLAQRMIDVV